MKKLKVGILAMGICLLVIFMGALLFIRERQPVLLADITFDIRAKEQDFKLKLWHNYYNGKEYLFLPSFCDEDASCLIQLEHFGAKVWDGEKLDMWGYLEKLETGEHTLSIKETEFTVVIMRSSKVPALFLTTESGGLEYIEAEKGNGEEGLYKMVLDSGETVSDGQLSEMKSRGNMTFFEDKKPYQISLVEPDNLLGSGNLEHYVLLANRQDRSLLRNRIIYDMAGEMGLDYSPVSRPVDLYINEEYRGSYQLSEKAEVASGRIAVDAEGNREDTGFFVALEYAERAVEEGNYFVTENEQSVIIRRPKNPSKEQRAHITEEFQRVEDGIRKGQLEEAEIDIASFAGKYLIEEIGKNLDAMHSSQYFYQDAGEAAKMYAGPVWDYDKTLGNPLIEKTRPVNFHEPRGIFAATEQNGASWWYDLYQIPEFKETVIEEYETSAVPAIKRMLEEGIDTYRDEIWDSAYMDYIRWDPFENFKYEEEPDFAGEFNAEIDGIRNFLELRMEFLNDIWLEGRIYNQITCDPGEGNMYVTQIDAIEGREINEPRDPKREGYDFDHWVRQDTGEVYDFTEIYDGIPFTLQAVYVKEE